MDSNGFVPADKINNCIVLNKLNCWFFCKCPMKEGYGSSHDDTDNAFIRHKMLRFDLMMTKRKLVAEDRTI